MAKAAVAVVAFLATLRAAGGCTVIAAGKDATKDGSVMVTHTDDMGTATNDLRLVRIPAAKWPEGSKRPVYKANDKYPRVITTHRGTPEYYPKEGEEEMEPLGFIPQVESTYGYYDQDFGIINDAQLVIGETTVAAKTAGWENSVPYGYNMMCMEELTKIAMERCDTARCAVQTMGDLAVEYGYFHLDSGDPANPVYGDSAEAAAVGDKYGEVWIFHVLTGAKNTSAVWAAARVPDDHVAVMANAMIIRQMNLDDPDNFLASDNVHSFAIEQGWWDPTAGPFDFTAAYAHDTSCSNNAWEYPLLALYSGRRHWRVYDLLSPSLHLDSTLGWVPTIPTYPFSMKPEKAPLGPEDLMAILRDNYDGSPYDLSKGIKGGPFSSPLQFDPGHYPGVQGGWERTIATYRMLFSFVAVARPDLPDHIGGMFWYGQSRSTTTVYVPFYAGQTSVPDSYLEGVESKFNFDSAWWPFTFVSNIAQLKWSLMFQDVKAEQELLESAIRADAARAEADALAVHEESGLEESIQLLQDFSDSQAAMVIQAWWELAWRLIQTYSNGFITHGESGERKRPGYPEWWLKATGEYENWPGNTFSDPRSPDMCGGDVIIVPSLDDDDDYDETSAWGSGAVVIEEAPQDAEGISCSSFSIIDLLVRYAPYLLFGAAMMGAGAAAGYALGRRGVQRGSYCSYIRQHQGGDNEGLRAPLL